MVRDARRRAPHHEGLTDLADEGLIDLIQRSIAKRCVSKDEAIEVEIDQLVRSSLAITATIAMSAKRFWLIHSNSSRARTTTIGSPAAPIFGRRTL